MSNITADVVIGLEYGDEAKSKVTNSLLKTKNYTHCLRFSGSHNAGHTSYQSGKKMITHVIPTGIFHNVKSIIGPGCVCSPRLLSEEILDLEEAGIIVEGKLFVDKRTNIITGAHLAEDSTDTKIGTTKKGNGPAYRDKYDRKGMRFEGIGWQEKKYKIIDVYEEFHSSKESINILCEGAQGFGLDIDWGDYPYVTSSHCTTASALLNGIPPQSLRRVFGVCKAYTTYVGAKKFQPAGDIFNTLREVGQEYGATTGRARQVNFLNLDFLVKSARINGTTDIIVNKMDVLQQINQWKVIVDNEVLDLDDEKSFKDYITYKLNSNVQTIRNHNSIKFSYSPEDISNGMGQIKIFK